MAPRRNEATTCDLGIAKPGSDLAGKCQLGQGEHALVIGDVNDSATVIKGHDLRELREFARRVQGTVLGALHGELPGVPSEVVNVVRAGHVFLDVVDDVVEGRQLPGIAETLDNAHLARLIEHLDSVVVTAATGLRQLVDEAYRRGDNGFPTGHGKLDEAVNHLTAATLAVDESLEKIDPESGRDFLMIA